MNGEQLGFSSLAGGCTMLFTALSRTLCYSEGLLITSKNPNRNRRKIDDLRCGWWLEVGINLTLNLETWCMYVMYKESTFYRLYTVIPAIIYCHSLFSFNRIVFILMCMWLKFHVLIHRVCFFFFKMLFTLISLKSARMSLKLIMIDLLW